jgi:hypothetical protein
MKYIRLGAYQEGLSFMQLVSKGTVMLESIGRIYGWPICEFMFEYVGVFYATT